MREAGEQIRRGGSLVMDMSASGDCDSAALGAMIEWRRMAEERKCRLSFENIDGRLAKLAQLYQVADLLGMGEGGRRKGGGGVGGEVAKREKFTVIDLFAGCGGLSLGMRNAGFRVLAAVGFGPARGCGLQSKPLFPPPSIRFWRKTCNISVRNLCGIASGIQDVDVIVAGLPCQGFSHARQVDGANNGKRLVVDKRRELFHPFMEYVRHFTTEGVRG